MRAERELTTLATIEGLKEPLRVLAIDDVKEIRSHGKVVAYLTELQPEGFIITSADTDIRPVLGYSFKGKFPFEDSKQNVLLHLVQWDVEACLNALSAGAKEENAASVPSNKELWDQYISTDKELVQTLSSATQWPDPAEYGHEGWITTQWEQSGHFDDKCPLVRPDETVRCDVGCTATAMAQILNYWKYPGKVSFMDESWWLGGDSYTSKGNAGEIQIDDDNDLRGFPTFDELNTALSSIDYNGDPQEEAYLCFATGIKMRMNYGLGSGAWPKAGAYTNGFGFGSADARYGDSCIWYLNRQTIIENIKKGWPVQIAILDISWKLGGHSVIVDGYKTTGDLHFHINYGWAGENDVWYNPPTINNYDMVVTVVCNICPYQGWNQWGADERNTFSTVYVAPTANPPVDKWQVTCPGDYYFTGLVVGTANKIYISCTPRWQGDSDRPSVWVIDQYGVKQKEITLVNENGHIGYPIQNKKGDVFVATDLGRVYRINPKTDAVNLLFSEPRQYAFYDPPKVDSDNYMYFGTDDKLYGLNENGSSRWVFTTPANTISYRTTPAVDVKNNQVYFSYYNSGTDTGFFVCLNRNNGNVIWTKSVTNITFEGECFGEPSIDSDGTIYVGCYTKLYAYSPSGTQKWVKDFYPGYVNDPATIGQNNTLYLSYWKTFTEQKVAAIDASNNGQIKWEIPSGATSTFDNVGDIYFCGNDVICYALSKDNGSDPDTYTVYAYRDSENSAEYLWHKEFGESGGMTAFGPGATIYVIPSSGYGHTIYAISEGTKGDPDGGGMAYTDNSAPAIPSNANPADDANNIGPSVMLSWTCSDPEEHSLRYALFVGESGYDMVPVDTNIIGTSYQLSGLKAGTGYVWKITATDGQAISEGPTWVFSTKPPNPDLNADGRVNFVDFAKVARYWDQSNWTGPENLDWVGDVEFVDVGIIAENWLQGQPIHSEMVLIPAGEFQMGDPCNEGESDERPVHAVHLDSFYMSKFEISNGQYCQFLNSALGQGLITVSSDVVYQAGSGTNYPYCDTSTSSSYSQIEYCLGPRSYVFQVRTKGGRDMGNDPMVMVSWYGAAAYCNWRSQEEGKEPCYDLSTWECDFSKRGYRLPTEAEWEYAARGGLPGKRFPWGDTITHNQANYYSSTSYDYDVSSTEGYHPTWNDGILPYTSPVASFSANGYGLYDMAGNVWEQCNDWYSGSYYSSSPVNNPRGPTSGSYRVIRGGCYGEEANGCRVAFRHHCLFGGPDNRGGGNGFRLVLDFQ